MHSLSVNTSAMQGLAPWQSRHRALLPPRASLHARVHRPPACQCSSESVAERLPSPPCHASLAAAAGLAAVCLQLSVAATPCHAREAAGVVPLKRSVVEEMLVQQFTDRVKQMSDAELAEALERALASPNQFPPSLLPPGPVKGPSLLSKLVPQPKPELPSLLPARDQQQQPPEGQQQGLNPLQFFQQPFAAPWQRQQEQQQEQEAAQQQLGQQPDLPSKSSGSSSSLVEAPTSSRAPPALSPYPNTALGAAANQGGDQQARGSSGGISISNDSAPASPPAIAGPSAWAQQAAEVAGAAQAQKSSTQHPIEGPSEELDLTQQLFERFGQLASSPQGRQDTDTSSSPLPGSSGGKAPGSPATVGEAISQSLASLQQRAVRAAPKAVGGAALVAALVYGLGPLASKAAAGLKGGQAGQGQGQKRTDAGSSGAGGEPTIAAAPAAARGAKGQAQGPPATPWWAWILQRLPLSKTGTADAGQQLTGADAAAAAAAAPQAPLAVPAPSAATAESSMAGLGAGPDALLQQALPGAGPPPPPPPFAPSMAPGMFPVPVGGAGASGSDGSSGGGVLWRRKPAGDDSPPAAAVAATPEVMGAGAAAGWQPQQQQQQLDGVAGWAEGSPGPMAARAGSPQQAGSPPPRADFWAMSDEELRNFQVWDGSAPSVARPPSAQAAAAPPSVVNRQQDAAAANSTPSMAGGAEGGRVAQRGAPLRRRRGGMMDNAEPADFAAPGASQGARSGSP